jgi:hypothetical protein
MANKNDTSDIKHFLFVTASVICALVAAVVFSLVIVSQKYGTSINFYEAELSRYIQQQWRAGTGK